MPFLPALMIKPWAQWGRGFVLSLTIQNTVIGVPLFMSCSPNAPWSLENKKKIQRGALLKIQPGGHCRHRPSTAPQLLHGMEVFSLSLGHWVLKGPKSNVGPRLEMFIKSYQTAAYMHFQVTDTSFPLFSMSCRHHPFQTFHGTFRLPSFPVLFGKRYSTFMTWRATKCVQRLLHFEIYPWPGGTSFFLKLWFCWFTLLLPINEI